MADTAQYELGMIGLGVMGRNLLLNMADHGFAVAGYNRDASKVELLNSEAAGRLNIQAFHQLSQFVNSLRTPRAVMLLVTAGAAVDAVIQELLPLLSPGDLIIDGGNSHFTDTNRRTITLQESGIQFFGMGVSGGEEGARHGPSLMPGGPKEAYERVRPIFEAIAAHVQGEPCVAWLGPGSAGHYVKMVHNGIEYGLMQLIAESYDLMKHALELAPKAMHEIFAQWNQTGLNSFLMEITAEIFTQKDPQTGNYLIDHIADVARQKGTGMWTSQDAMQLQTPVPTIDMAVAMRDLSALKSERQALLGAQNGQNATRFSGTFGKFAEDRSLLLAQLPRAMDAAIRLTYAQGMSLLQAASKAYEYDLHLETVATIWRGGCIIRAALLEEIREAYRQHPTLPTLLLDQTFAAALAEHQDDLRAVITTAVSLGIPVPGLMASLAYYDAYHATNLPTNLIQAQRDYFGAHTYERTDKPGVFHTVWGSAEASVEANSPAEKVKASK